MEVGIICGKVYNFFRYKCPPLTHLIPDKLSIHIDYALAFGRKMDLKDPKTYNEKIQWLKLYNRRPEYTQMVDKFAVREYIAEQIGKEHLIPLLGVWDSVAEIDFDALPDQFVLKCTHDSGGLVVCKDKSKLDIEAAKERLRTSLTRDFYKLTREWPYKNVPRRIVAEQYMVDESGTELKDYKFFCFDGKAKAFFIATDRPYATKFDFYDMDFNHLPFTNGHPSADRDILKPPAFDQMRAIAEQLSKGMPHVRVDLYDINGTVYFGELTFYHWSGLVPFVPEEWDRTFGDWIELPKEKRKRNGQPGSAKK